MSELSQYNDDGNVLTHGNMANRKPRGRKPLDYQDNKGKVWTWYGLSKQHVNSFALFSSEPVPWSALPRRAQTTPCLRPLGKFLFDFLQVYSDPKTSVVFSFFFTFIFIIRNARISLILFPQDPRRAGDHPGPGRRRQEGRQGGRSGPGILPGQTGLQ